MPTAKWRQAQHREDLALKNSILGHHTKSTGAKLGKIGIFSADTEEIGDNLWLVVEDIHQVDSVELYEVT